MACVPSNSPIGTKGWIRRSDGIVEEIIMHEDSRWRTLYGYLINGNRIIFETEAEAATGIAKKTIRKIRKNGKTHSEISNPKD